MDWGTSYYGGVFGRKKTTEQDLAPDSATVESVEHTEEPVERHPRGYTPPKGSPTPSRKEREQANRKPLISDDRKEARRQHREAVAEQRAKMRRAMDTGEEKYLPFRDQGPQKRFARDFVDARTGVGEWLMLVMLVLLALAFIQSVTTQWIVMYGMLAMIFIVVVESIVISRAVSKRLEAKFGAVEPGVRWYAAMRGMQLRRMRLPKPQVKRGEYPTL